MRKWVVILAGLLVASGLLVWLTRPSLEPQVVMCNVGQGDGMIITQGRSQMVIDVGRANGLMNQCLGEVLPFWDREIERVVITHADSDHSGGLAQVMESYVIDEIVTSEQAEGAIRARVPTNIPVLVATVGQTWAWGRVQGEVMWPPALKALPPSMARSSNDTGLVLRLVFNNKESVWLAADVGQAVEEKMIEMGLVKTSTVLKVSHHGSKYATTSRFLAILRPRWFLVSVGKNSYGHPSTEVLARIATFGGQLWRTDQQGMWRWRPER